MAFDEGHRLMRYVMFWHGVLCRLRYFLLYSERDTWKKIRQESYFAVFPILVGQELSHILKRNGKYIE